MGAAFDSLQVFRDEPSVRTTSKRKFTTGDRAQVYKTHWTNWKASKLADCANLLAATAGANAARFARPKSIHIIAPVAISITHASARPVGA